MAIEIEIDGLFSDYLADSVVYNNGTDLVDIKAIVDLGSIDGSAPGRQAVIIVRKIDVQNPKYRQSFVINDDTWTIAPETGKDFVLYQSSGLWSLRIEKDIRSSSVCRK